MIGQRLLHYEITAKLGEGGMGAVYRARDARLDREVAIKVLPPTVGQDSEFRARFDREAKTISSLNHPNICTLYDVGHEDGTHFLVMELIEGDTLAERLEKGPLPLDQVLRYGAQIAEALDQAHKQGIVHRDLKPGNVMLAKSGAKLLDFGLARPASESAPVQGLTEMPTEAQPLTAEGTILGTFLYMAPEQLEGIEADPRTDIFALGAVLYEMATGQRAFQGETRTSLIAAIVSSQPQPISAVTAMSPPALDHVVRRCLEKDPDDRWQSAHDLASELRWVGEAGSQIGVPAAVVSSRRMRRSVLAALAVAGWIVAAAAVAWITLGPRPTRDSAEPFRADLVTPAAMSLAGVPAGAVRLSPTGDRLAFVGSDSEVSGLVVQSFTTGKVRMLEGTEGAIFPFWSPDGRWLAFFADQKLKKISAEGGPVQMLADAPAGRGGTWSADGTIVFAADITSPLMRVADSGGEPQPVTALPEGRYTHRNPHFLPDGEHFLFIQRETRDQPVGNIALGSITGGEHSVVIERGSNPQWADGFVLFVRDRNLVAQRFDPKTLEASGSLVPIADSIEYYNPRDIGNFSVSTAGPLVFRKQAARKTQLTWFDREGRQLETFGEPQFLTQIQSVSDDGRRAAVKRRDEAGLTSDIWLVDLEREQMIRSTFISTSGDIWAALSGDGSRLAVSSFVGSGWAGSALWLQSSSGSGDKEILLESTSFMVSDWSGEDRYLVGTVQEAETGHDVAYIDLAESPEIRIFVGTQFTESGPRLAPDGRWLAYVSTETGRAEVYLSDFPAGTRKWQVSQSGGLAPFWSRDGRTLYYWDTDGALHAVAFGEGDPPILGSPALVLAADALSDDVAWFHEPAADPVLGLKYASSPVPEPLRVIRNWQALLEER